MRGISYRFWPVLIVFILVSTTACSISDINPFGKTGSTQAVKTGSELTPLAVKTSDQPSENETPSGLSEVTEQPGPADEEKPPAQDINPGLEALGNYRVTLTITGQGKTDEQIDIKETYTALEENNITSKGQHIKNTDNTEADTSSITDMDFYAIKDQVYLLDNTTDPVSCTVFGSGEGNIESLGGIKPGQLFVSITKGDLVTRGETVNNIKADHYTAKEISMSLGDPTSISGDIWYAQDGSYIVRFTGKADGKFLLSSYLINGSVTWDYEVTDINKVGEMLEPAICTEDEGSTTPNLNEIPIPDNATDKQVLGDFIAYGTPDDADTVLAYYREKLPAIGWKIDEDAEMDNAFLLGISKNNNKLEITVIPEDPSGCSVVVNTTE